MRLGATRQKAVSGGGRVRDPYWRTYLSNPAADYLRPGCTYTRTTAVQVPQADGTLKEFAANVIPREYSAGQWWYRFDPTHTHVELNSHNFGAAYWGKSDVQTPTQDVAGPGGVGLAWRLRENTVNAYHGFTANPTAAFSTTYTHHIVVRGVGRTQAQINFSALFGLITFDLTTGAVVGTPPGAVTRYSCQQLADGYWLITLTFATPASGSNLLYHAITPAISGSAIYVGDASKGLDVLCSTITDTAYPVPITVTTTAPVPVGNPSLSWAASALGLNLAAGFTAGVEYSLAGLVPSYQPLVMAVSDNTFNNSVYLNAAAVSGVRPSVVSALSGGVAQADQLGLGPSATVGAARKVVFRAFTNSMRVGFDGGLSIADNVASVPPVDRVYLGTNWSGTAGNVMMGRIGESWLSPKALTDTDLAVLSDTTVPLLLPDLNYISSALLEYTRTGDLWCPQKDGTLKAFAANQLPREWDDQKWTYRFDQAWTQRALSTDLFTTAAWVASDTAVTDGAYTAPDGTTYAKVVASATNANHILRQTITYSSGEVTTISFLLRAAEESVLVARGGSGATVWGISGPVFATFNASTGVATVGPYGTSASMRRVHGDAWLCSVTTVATTGAGNAHAQLLLRQTTAYLGDGASGLFVGRFNVTNTSYPVPLTVAMGTPVSIANPTMTFAVPNGVVPAAGFTYYGEVETLGKIALQYPSVVNFRPSTIAGSNDSVEVFINPTVDALFALARVASVDQYGFQIMTPTKKSKFAMRAAVNDFQSAADGVLNPVDNTGTLPTITHIQVGRNGTANFAAMRLAKLAVTQRLVTGSDLTALTT